DAVWTLIEPKTELDQLFVKCMMHCFSLEKRAFSSIVSSVQPPYNLALVENMFRAALVLGNGRAMSAILEMDQTSLANRNFTFQGVRYFPLGYASSQGHVQVVQALLDHGADINQQNYILNLSIRMPWDRKPRTLNVEVLQLLFDHGLELDPAQSAQTMTDCSRDILSLLITHCLSKSFETFFKHEGLPRLLLREDEDDPPSKILGTILNQAFLQMDGRQEVWNSILSLSLSAAILRRHESAVNLLLSMGATPDIHCLISAAQSNDVQVFEEFLSRGLDPVTRTYDGTVNVRDRFTSRPLPPPPPPNSYEHYFGRKNNCTALSESVRNRSRGVFQRLEEQGFVSKLSRRPAEFASTFLAACEVGESALIDQLLAMPNFPRRREQLPWVIENAVEEDQHHIVEKLLSAGFRPTSRSLVSAVRKRKLAVVILLAKDVDLIGPVGKDPIIDQSSFHPPDIGFTSPLAEAVRQHAEINDASGALDLLLPLVKDLNTIVHRTWKDGNMTALHWAISLCSLATVQKLHQAGANISLPAEWLIERTPLQAASEAGSKDIVEYLLSEGVNPNEFPSDRGGATALQLAAISGNIGIATVLLDNGADVNAPPAFCDGRTAFEGATEHGRLEMMIFLVSQNADLLSNEGAQCRRAMEFAENNSQHIAKNLAKDLYEKVLASQVTNVFGMGRDVWPGPDMSILGGLLS
ncbi:unnamed protein product, partial [Alternaria alternata]